MMTERVNKIKYRAVRLGSGLAVAPSNTSGSFLTKIKQHTVIKSTERAKGIAIIPMNSSVGILKLE